MYVPRTTFLAKVTETENHILMINGTYYLKALALYVRFHRVRVRVKVMVMVRGRVRGRGRIRGRVRGRSGLGLGLGRPLDAWKCTVEQ